MKKCAEMGIFGLMVPEEFGGTNLGNLYAGSSSSASVQT